MFLGKRFCILAGRKEIDKVLSRSFELLCRIFHSFTCFLLVIICGGTVMTRQYLRSTMVLVVY